MFSTAADGYFMEFDSARAGSFDVLRLLPRGKKVVLGLVTTKVGSLESKDELKRRIDEAAKVVPLENLCLSPQCGFSEHAPRQPAVVRRAVAQARTGGRGRARGLGLSGREETQT